MAAHKCVANLSLNTGSCTTDLSSTKVSCSSRSSAPILPMERRLKVSKMNATKELATTSASPCSSLGLRSKKSAAVTYVNSSCTSAASWMRPAASSR